MQICPTCGSTRIGHFRLDADWGSGGDWFAQNEPESEAGYTELDMEGFRQNERPDVECCVCCQCSTCFEPKAANVK